MKAKRRFALGDVAIFRPSGREVVVVSGDDHSVATATPQEWRAWSESPPKWEGFSLVHPVELASGAPESRRQEEPALHWFVDAPHRLATVVNASRHGVELLHLSCRRGERDELNGRVAYMRVLDRGLGKRLAFEGSSIRSFVEFAISDFERQPPWGIEAEEVLDLVRTGHTAGDVALYSFQRRFDWVEVFRSDLPAVAQPVLSEQSYGWVVEFPLRGAKILHYLQTANLPPTPASIEGALQVAYAKEMSKVRSRTGPLRFASSSDVVRLTAADPLAARWTERTLNNWEQGRPLFLEAAGTWAREGA